MYLSLGDGRHVNEIRFSVLTAAKFLDEGNWRIVLYTDSERAFTGLPVEVRPVAANTATDWAGPHNYVYRSKILALAASLTHPNTDRSVIVDGDTYFKRSPAVLFSRLVPGTSLMHLREGPPAPPEVAALQWVLDKTEPVNIDGSLWGLTPSATMWNSGVVGLHQSDVRLCDEAVHLVDQLLDHGFGRFSHTAEMVAFGVCLDRGSMIRPCDDVVAHYWLEELRQPFEIRLGDVWSNRTLSHEERYCALWRHRPREGVKRRSKFLFKRLAWKVGVEL